MIDITRPAFSTRVLILSTDFLAFLPGLLRNAAPQISRALPHLTWCHFYSAIALLSTAVADDNV
ncbi:MAG: hypothetical protein ACREQV_09215 [Candidatus Binatia bacterium]